MPCTISTTTPRIRTSILNILDECERAGSPDMAFEFCSTSKITFPGAGIAAFVSSEANVAEACANMGAQTIGFDKLNQLRHVRFLKDAPTLAAHMSKHAALLRPQVRGACCRFSMTSSPPRG